MVVVVVIWLAANSQRRKAQSKEPVLSQRSLADILAKDFHSSVRSAIAGNPNTPVYLLEQLANDEDAVVRGFVARNPNAPGALLEKLSYDENSIPRNGVAMNTHTPGRVLSELAQRTLDSRWPGYEIAKNPSTPPETLELLVSKRRSEVALNPSAPQHLLEQLPEYVDMSQPQDGISMRHFVRSNVAQNPSTPDYLLERLAFDAESSVRYGVEINPSTPPRCAQGHIR